MESNEKDTSLRESKNKPGGKGSVIKKRYERDVGKNVPELRIDTTGRGTTIVQTIGVKPLLTKKEISIGTLKNEPMEGDRSTIYGLPNTFYRHRIQDKSTK
jgi:hypothetical protein